MRIQDVTAQVGGFINGIMIIFQIFMKFFQDYEIKKIIINNIFDLENSLSKFSNLEKINE